MIIMRLTWPGPSGDIWTVSRRSRMDGKGRVDISHAARGLKLISKDKKKFLTITSTNPPWSRHSIAPSAAPH